MTDIILWLAIGAFIGWNFPQPGWAVWLQSRMKTFFNKEVK